MFESILNFFSDTKNLGSVFTAGTSIFNTYASMQASNEARSEKAFDMQQILAFDKEKIKDATREYGAIVSYNMDLLRQQQLNKRQKTAYHLLRTGIGVTSRDSAGLMLRHQAHMDEMAARAQEATYVYKRPRSSINEPLFHHKISSLQSAAPYENIAIAVRGARDLSSILEKISEMDNV